MRRLLLLLPVMALVAAPRVAHAAPCSSLPNPVYIMAGDTQTNLLRRLARKLRDNTPKPITLVFQPNGSCTNIDAMYNKTAVTGNFQYVPSIAEDPNWNPANATASPTIACTPDAGKTLDVANSALFNSACTSAPLPDHVHSQQGPVQAYVMAVPAASSQKAITFEEAYFVFGFGMAGMVSPWTDETNMFIRTITKSTLLAWAANITVPGDKWKGKMLDKSGDVVNGLLASTAPENAIGILGAEVADGMRDKLHVLAYRAKGQYAAYYPDSTATARDKKNLRDGHYTVWSPTIWMDVVNGTTPANDSARYVIDLISGKSVTPAPNFDMIAEIAAVGLVPDCAMGVNRTFEGGPLSIYHPAESCTCKYESLVDQTSCQTCPSGTCAGGGVCRNNFCEAN